MMIQVIKKDQTLQDFDPQKIIDAIGKSAERVMVDLSEDDENVVVKLVLERIGDQSQIPVKNIHNFVELALDDVNSAVAKSYREYRDHKLTYAEKYKKVYKEAGRIRSLGDKENSNADSELVSTQRVLVLNELNKEHYKQFFLNPAELQDIRDGYYYIHDMSARLDTMNCCLFDLETVFKGGFEMANMHYTEPKSIEAAFDVAGDVILSVAAQQYGGFTIPEIDKTLATYAEKTYQRYQKEYGSIGIGEMSGVELAKIQITAVKATERAIEQGWQGLEYKLNTVGSSRGDYPFVTVTAGLATDFWGKKIAEIMFKVRMEGQGKKGFKKPVLFPKLVFLYDEKLHGKGQKNEDLFDLAIQCSSKAMYPDFLSLTGRGYVPEMYKKHGAVVSPMGCRAFLSPWYERGGMEPVDDQDKPVFVGRWNAGAISLHLPMILAKARQEQRDFYEVLDEYLEKIRRLHIRTRDYLAKKPASTNPVAFTQGGFYQGFLEPNDKIEPLLKYVTFSFGITALNELQQLYNQKSMREDNQFAIKVMRYINAKLVEFKKADNILYAIYGTPAESLCGTQIKQFRNKYGVIENVSDRDYVTNSFHLHVTEDVNPIEKQSREAEFWDLFNGGKIQYVKYPLDYNIKALKTLVRRAMHMGFYEGINLALSYCEQCGHEENGMEVCTVCGSDDLTKIDRMNGYLSFSRVKGETRLNEAKQTEIEERVSM